MDAQAAFNKLDTDRPSDARPAAAPWRGALWLAMACLAALLIAGQWWFSKRYRYESAIEQKLEAADKKAADKILARLHQISLSEMQEVAVNNLLEEYRPWTIHGGVDGYPGFSDPVSGYHFALDFRDGWLRSYAYGPRRKHAPNLAAWGFFRKVHQCLSGVALMGWVGSLVAAANLRRRQRSFGELMLALSILFAISIVVSDKPGESMSSNWLRWSIWASPWMIGVGATMMLLPTKIAVGARRCAQCDYDLRGNASGICPECGTPIPPAAYDPVELAGRLAAVVEPEVKTPSELEQSG